MRLAAAQAAASKVELCALRLPRLPRAKWNYAPYGALRYTLRAALRAPLRCSLALAVVCMPQRRVSPWRATGSPKKSAQPFESDGYSAYFSEDDIQVVILSVASEASAVEGSCACIVGRAVGLSRAGGETPAAFPAPWASRFFAALRMTTWMSSSAYCAGSHSGVCGHAHYAGDPVARQGDTRRCGMPTSASASEQRSGARSGTRSVQMSACAAGTSYRL
jgi:hypothetical protein